MDALKTFPSKNFFNFVLAIFSIKYSQHFGGFNIYKVKFLLSSVASITLKNCSIPINLLLSISITLQSSYALYLISLK